MNKLAKGAVAGAAGLVLLLGGAGTFAYWNSTADIAGGTITAGNLLVENTGGPGVWTDQNGTTVNIATYRIVPGDTLTYTDGLTVTAQGDNLVATLGLGANSITPTSSTPANDALATYLSTNAVTSLVATTGGGVSGASPTYTITGTAAGLTIPVTAKVVLTFPNTSTAGAENLAKLGSVNLSNMTLTLTQTAPAVTP